METKELRPVQEITTDLQSVAKTITECEVKVEQAKKNLSYAQNELTDLQNKARVLRAEMEEFLNYLVPNSQKDRVRTSS